ncbi:beta-adaptin A-like protein, partial [Trifolium medium]
VRLHVLTAVMKCFFKRPPETQKALGAARAAGLADFHQVTEVVIRAKLDFAV